METFNFKIGINPTTDYRVTLLQTDMGEDHHQHEEISGINQESRKWRVERVDNLPHLKPIRDFVRRHRGFKSFLWVTPEGETVKVKATEMSLATTGPFRGKISMTLEETFSP